jgi:uncharacterized protein (DUF1697 family)
MVAFRRARKVAKLHAMATWIALLRGIGGGIRSLEMAKLVRALEGIGLEDVRTYIATGNVVFTSSKTALQLSKAIEGCIEKKFGFSSKTFVLSPKELAKAAADNPFPQANDNHKSLHLFFLSAAPKKPNFEGMDALKAPSEQYVLKGKVFYFFAPEGFGDSKLGARIVRSGFRPSFLVGVWRGGAPVGITVQEVLEYNGIECDHLAIRTSSYEAIDQPGKVVRVHAIDYLVSQLTAEDRLLIIDDVFDSGRSLEAVLAELQRRCRRNLPGEIRIATIYYKPARNRSTLKPDYYTRSTDQWLVFPHELRGLTREEILAHKPIDPSFFQALDE